MADVVNFTTEGYTDLRTYMQTTWDEIEVRNDSQSALFRLPVSDARVTWTSDATANPLTIEVVLTGSDAEISVGSTTVQGAALFKDNTGGSSMLDVTYDTAFTFQNAEDQLTLRITMNAPAV